MQVITIESEAFNAIIRQLEEIKLAVTKKEKQTPLSEVWIINEDAAQLLNVSKRTLQTYRDEGILSFSQIGSKIYYRASDIEAHLQKHYNKAFKK